jgi:hypothetical protein
MIRAYHLYTGPDGNSHVVRGSVSGGELVEAESILFKETPAHTEHSLLSGVQRTLCPPADLTVNRTVNRAYARCHRSDREPVPERPKVVGGANHISSVTATMSSPKVVLITFRCCMVFSSTHDLFASRLVDIDVGLFSFF